MNYYYQKEWSEKESIMNDKKIYAQVSWTVEDICALEYTSIKREEAIAFLKYFEDQIREVMVTAGSDFIEERLDEYLHDSKEEDEEND